MNFYPRPPRGGRPLQIRLDETADRFLSTPSARRATIPFSATLSLPMYFYPRPPRGGRPLALQQNLFLSTPSARRATRLTGASPSSDMDFYPRPPRGGRPRLRVLDPFVLEISIHALREEGDDDPADDRIPIVVISIHALREEGDLGRGSSKQSMANFYPRPPRGGRQFFPVLPEQSIGFLSTPSARRATLCGRIRNQKDIRFLSTPSARRATAHKCPHCAGLHISIHALREEGDLPWLSLCSAIGKFLSTPSARRATDAPLIWATSLMYFYPRPLRGGRRFRPCSYTAPWYFYPRPLRGGRQPSVSAPGCNYIFLSTPSARRATGESCHRGCRRDISIHALCEEGDA